jgi:hypothetical protein
MRLAQEALVRKVLVVVVLVAVAGVPGWWLATRGGLGLSPEAPLGRLTALEALLTERGIVQRAVKRSTEDALPEGLEVREYLDSTTVRGAEIDFYLRLVAGRDGRVREVRASFWSADADADDPLRKTECFVADLWCQASGRRPSFADERQIKGHWITMFRVARFDQGPVHGEWRKRYLENLNALSIVDEVRIWLD